MPESLGAPGLRKRTPPTRSLFASFAGCRQNDIAEAWGTRASSLNAGASWLPGPAGSREGGGPSEKATSQPCLAQVVAEAKRVVDNGTLKDMRVVIRRFSSTSIRSLWIFRRG